MAKWIHFGAEFASFPHLGNWLTVSAGLRLTLVLVVLGSPVVRAAEKPKETNPPAPPHLVIALPPAAVRGVTNSFTLRGARLKEMTELRLISAEQTNVIAYGKVEDVDLPDRYKADQAGDQKTAVQFMVPSSLPDGTNLFLVAVSSLGEDRPLPLFVVGSQELEGTMNPADGFREATHLPMGRFIRGQLDKRHEVAVFQLEGRAGQRVRAEVWAQRLGSTLDAALTLHDFRGAVLDRNDDAQGRDPLLEATLPAGGIYFLSLAGMDERSSPTHVYLLRATLQ